MISCILSNLISSLSSFSFIPSSVLYYTAFSKFKNDAPIAKSDTCQSVFLGYSSPSDSHKALYSFGFHDIHPSFSFQTSLTIPFYFSLACPFRISISQNSVLKVSQSAYFSYINTFTLIDFNPTAQVQDTAFLPLTFAVAS